MEKIVEGWFGKGVGDERVVCKVVRVGGVWIVVEEQGGFGDWFTGNKGADGGEAAAMQRAGTEFAERAAVLRRGVALV